MYPTKRLRQHFDCKLCIESTSTVPQLVQCEECNQNLLVNCPHDGFNGRRRCSTCIDRMFNQIPVCRYHGKIINYYCLNCERGVCAECLLRSAGHDDHIFEQLEKLYQERFELAVRTMDEAADVITRNERVCNQIARNLQLVTTNEMELINEVEAVAESAKAEIRASVWERKELLGAKLEQPMRKHFYRNELEKVIYNLSKHDFLQKHGDLMEQIRQHTPADDRLEFEIVEHHDINCFLIPRMSMDTLIVNEIWKKKSPISVTIVDGSGFQWTTTLFVHQTISVQFFAKNKQQESLPHKVAIEIVHQDIATTIRQSFIIQNCEQKLELAVMKQLNENGFITENNTLTLRIGIRPMSLIVENQLIKQENLKLRESVNEEVEMLQDEIVRLKNYTSSNFHVSMTALKELEECVHSHPVTDSQGVEWCLRVKRTIKTNRKKKQNNIVIGVYIVQYSGPPSRCKYNVVMHNNNPDLHIKMSGEEIFESDEHGIGRHSFVDLALLTEDSGFVTCGKVRFQFGVIPVVLDEPIIEGAEDTEANETAVICGAD